MAKAQSGRLRLFMFAALYCVQGVALAFVSNFGKPYLDRFGIDADLIAALAAILLVPFVLKILLGMLSDKFSLLGLGHRRPYIMAGLLLAAGGFGGAAFVPPDRLFWTFAALNLVGALGVALFDTTSDGLAIDVTSPSEYGLVQGVMVTGRAVGFIVMSLAFGAVVESAGYRMVLLSIAGSMFLPLPLVWRCVEPAGRDASRQFEWGAFRHIISAPIVAFAGYAVLYTVVSYGVDGLVTYFMSHEFAAPSMAIGTYGALRGIGAALGAIIGGRLIGQWGRRTCAFGAAALVSIAAVALGRARTADLLLALSVLWGMVWGFQETIFLALAMDLSDLRIAATMFAVWMAISNVGVAIGEGLATGLSDNVGFQADFSILAAINLATAVALWALFRLAPQLKARAASGIPQHALRR